MIRLLVAALAVALVLPLTACETAPPDAVGAAIAAFAQGGVAVMDDVRSTAPIDKLDGPPSAMRFTRWQVQNIVNEAQTRNGYGAADLDALVPAPAGTPRFSQLLAAWLLRDQGALAHWSRAQYASSTNYMKPDTLTYSNAAVMLFIADIARPDATALAPRPHVDFERVIATPAQADGICTDVTNWVGQVANNTLAAVQARGSGFLSTFWNVVVTVVGATVDAVVTNILPTLLAYVTKIATIAATLFQITSLLKPWTVTVAPNPAMVTLDSAPVAGTFTATLNAAAIQWPQSLIDCVAALAPGTNLQTAPFKDAPVTWNQQVGIPSLASNTTSDTTLKDDETAAYGVTTITSAKPPESMCPVLVPDGTIGITVAVQRNDIKQVVNSLQQLLLGDIPSTLRGFLQPYIQSAVDSASATAAAKFSSPTAHASIAVSQWVEDPACNHTPPPQPTPGPTATSGRHSGDLPLVACSKVVESGDAGAAYPGNTVVQLSQQDQLGFQALMGTIDAKLSAADLKAKLASASFCFIGSPNGTQDDGNGGTEPAYNIVAVVVASTGEDAPVESDPDCAADFGTLLTSTDAICSGGGVFWNVYDTNASYMVFTTDKAAVGGTLPMLKSIIARVEGR
jgi:hypothetical protein